MLNDYQFLDEINDTHKVYLVKNKNDNCLYVEKMLSVYDIDIYKYLLNKKFYGIPKIAEIVLDGTGLVVFEEYISGFSLEELMDKGYQFSNDEIKNIAITLCKIMSGLNKDAKIVHRDIKPSNIIKSDNMYYLVDFNAAKFVDESKPKDTVLLGTQGYAAPEQYGFGSSTTQTDIYSIGMLIKELSNGSLSKEFKEIVNTCCQMDPKNRYHSFEELEIALSYKKRNKYTLVGYRSHNTIKKIIASLYYFFMLFGTYTLTSENGNKIDIYLSKLAFFIISFSLPQITFNYCKIHEKMGINKLSLPIKVITIILIDTSFTLSVAFIFIVLNNIIYKLIS